MKTTQVLETCVYVDDLEAAEAFYTRVLGLEAFAREPRRDVFFRCGETVFLVFNPDATQNEDPGVGVPRHGAKGSGHVCFTMKETEIEAWKTHLSGNGVEIEKEITWPSGGFSIYFRDPDGNCVELATRKTWNLGESAPAPA